MKHIFGSNREKSVKKVKEYYNYSTDIYRKTTGDFIHGYAAFDPDFFIDHIKEHVLINSEQVLDAGCGLGAVSIALAKKTDHVKFTGVTISEVQQKLASEAVVNEKLEARIEIKLGDFHQLSRYFEENTFDTILFVESMLHSNDLPHLFKEAYQVLKPNGRLYCREIFKVPYSSKKDQKKADFVVGQIQKNYSYFPRTLEEVSHYLKEAGFSILSAEKPPYPSDFDQMIKFEKAIGFDTYKYIADFPATEWYEVICTR